MKTFWEKATVLTLASGILLYLESVCFGKDIMDGKHSLRWVGEEDKKKDQGLGVASGITNA